jgi:peroxiredoxin Q/BCP
MAKAQTIRKTKTKSKSKTKIRVGTKKTKMPKRKKAAKKAVKKTAKPASKTAKIAKAKKPMRAAISKLKVVKAATATETHRIGVGDFAPNFTLPDQNGQSVSLSDFLGKKVVLYFYPKDDTPGCTKEACSFRDNINDFEGQDATILGVSFDDGESHQKFISKYGLNFRLLTDADKKIAQDYGCYVQKNMYGNISWGIERSTFVIDREGKIAAAFRKVQVDGHTYEVVEALKSIQ